MMCGFMSLRRFLAACVVLVLACGPHVQAFPQTPAAADPAVDPAVVELALAAATDEARAALFAAHPEMGTESMRSAIGIAARQRFVDGGSADALNGYRTVLYLAERTGNLRWRMLGLQGIGTLAGQRGDFAMAEPALVEALSIANSIAEADVLIVASNNLGIVQRLQGKYDDAIANYQRTLAVAEKAGRRDSVARTLNNLGVVAQAQGDARSALDYLTRSLALKEELGQTQDLVTTAVNIGDLHQYQRNFSLALDYFERGRELAVKAGVRRGEGSALTAIGGIHAVEGRYDAAKNSLLQALSIAEALDDPLAAASAWHLLGSVARYERRWAESEEAYQRGLAIREAIGDKPGVSLTLTGLADLFLAEGQPDRAVGFAERAVEVGRAIGQIQSRWSALRALGSAQAALGRTDAAVGALRESIDVVEQGRRQVAGGAEDLQRFFEDKTAPYYELAALYASNGRPAEAFATVERARARALLDVIETGKPIVGALTDAERVREDQLDRGLVSLNVQRAAAAARTPVQPEQVRQLDDALARARRARDEWQYQIYAAHPELRFGRGETPAVSLDETAAALAPGTAIAMFMSSADRLRLLLLTRAAGQQGPSVRIFTIPLSREDLARRAQSFNEQISRRDLGFAPAARALYDTLLGSADASLRTVSRLAIVPDGSLWDVPFQALITPRGRFVIEERAVSYSPSVSTLLRLQDRRGTRTSGVTRLVAIGDPSGASPGAPARLPEAAREVRSIAAMYGSGSRLFVGGDATEERLREAAPTATVLHIATHGELVQSSPMYSFVTLTGTGETDLTRDGRVEAWEIANMRLQANLVVLSACETARGGLRSGEGVMGLSWSLFAAGASTAAVSLWKVDSASTTNLMLAFHRSLLGRGREPVAPAEAMQAAARTLLASSRYRHPFYWAGFVVVGAP
ncbi:MAG: CHAT domain-containing protein [Acidobacteria bacterium]|nr:CHAT domain-containing protein [Acidobacteriota bacterium]